MVSTKSTSASSYMFISAAIFVLTVFFLFILLDVSIALLLSFLLLATILSTYMAITIYREDKATKDAEEVIASLDGKNTPASTHSKEIFSRFDQQIEKTKTISSELENIRQAFQKASFGFILLDQSGKVILLNESAKTILEIAKIKEQQYYEDIFLNEQLKEITKKSLSGNEITDKLQLSYNLRTIEVQALPLTKKTDDKIISKGCAITLQDITRIDALADVKKDFVANVSHDLRTPITSIKSLTEALLAGAKDNPKTLNRFLKELDQQSERLSILARDILDLSKIENKKTTTLKKMSIAPLLKQSIKSNKIHASSKGLSISLKALDNAHAKVDAEQLMKALNNLIDNSIKYTPDNGKISVDLYSNNGSVNIAIKDTGIGITQKELPRIFERFYRVSKSRSRSGGTGLGLSIVKHVVENHNGNIEVKSQLNKGSEFIISLPK